MKKFTRLLSDNGIRLLTGSDTYGMVLAGFSLHEEFQFLQQAGITPYHILMASTVHPVRYLNEHGASGQVFNTDASEGTIVEGKTANLILLAKNPLEDIRNTREIEGVLLNGKWF
jgi:imidazolonepropionase-like amidohydrolase